MAHSLPYEEFALDNGMNVVVVPDHRVPVVIHSVWYFAGSADEKNFRENKTGIAHMLEHMMFKGTKDIPAGDFARVVARNGGELNAFTSRDYTAYYEKVALDRLPLMMKMEADRMVNLDITDKVFQPERDVVLEERRMRTDSRPTSRFFEKLVHAHYGDVHPYGHPIIGWKGDIEGYTLQDNIDWYNTHYAPDNSVMILVGDITAEQAKPLVEEHYGHIKPRDLERKPWPTLPSFNEARELIQEDAETKVPVFYRLYRAPSALTGMTGGEASIKEAVALTVLAEILGDGSTGELYKSLVEEKQLADAASMDYDASSRGESSLDIFIQPKPGVTLKTVEAEMENVFANFMKNGVERATFERIKTALKADDVYAQDDPFHKLYRLGRWLVAGGSPATFDDWLTELDKITLADVEAAAEKYLNVTQSTTGYLVSDKSQLN